MTLKSSRSLEEMRPVMKDPASSGPDPVYEVYTNLDNSWINQTVIHPGLLGEEYTKTFGHHHTIPNSETYLVSQGEGLLLLQTKAEFKTINAKAGDRLVIPKEAIHAWVNTGDTDLVLYDDWNTPHLPEDYEVVKNHHGLANYIINDNGQPKTVPNPQWLTA